MADNYEILASETVPEQVTPTLTRQVDQVTARALPSGIVFYVRYTSVIDDPENVHEIETIWAGWLNELNATPGVVSVQWIQDIDESDQVVDTLNITVDSSSGKMQTTLIGVPTEETVAQWQARVAAARKGLDAVEAL